MRLLFVHEVNWRRKVVYEMHDFPELLTLRGHEIVFIDFPEDEPRSGWRRLLDLKTDVEQGACRAHRGASIEVRTPGRVLAPPFDRPLATLTQGPALWRALSRGNFDAMVLYAVPTNGWQAVLLARHLGVPVMFRAIDCLHDFRTTVYRPLIKWAERFVYRRVDALVANNAYLQQYCIDLGAAAETSSVVYPGLDLERFHPGTRDAELARRYGIGEKDKVVLYMGTLFSWSGLDQVIDHLAPFLKLRPDVKFVLVGGGQAEAELRQRVRKYALGDAVIFTGYVDYTDLGDHLRLADVAISPLCPSPAADLCIPAKVFQYCASGLAIVSTPRKGLQAIIPARNGCIEYRELGAGFAEAIAGLVDDGERRRQMGHGVRALAEEKFQWADCVQAFENCIVEMVGRHARRG